MHQGLQSTGVVVKSHLAMAVDAPSKSFHMTQKQYIQTKVFRVIRARVCRLGKSPVQNDNMFNV